MSENGKKKSGKKEIPTQTTHLKKQQGRYSGGDKKEPEELNEAETGLRQSRGKKQRRQFKLAPNRG